MTAVQGRESVAGQVTGEALLRVRDLTVVFRSRDRADVRAVDGISYDLAPGSTTGIVGESGSGKSVSSLAALGLLPRRGVQVSGTVEYQGRDLLTLPDRELRDLRGNDIAMVFQDPMSSLNPVLTVGRQLTEVLQRHEGLSGRAARDKAADLLASVGIPDPVRRLRAFPHQLSGGMRQRVMIAIALACKPRLLIADEPTTALDVTISAQILELLKELVRGSGTALVLITHDLGVVAGLCDTVHVMYSGRIVESATRRELFAAPRHPYTTGLLASVPRLDQARGEPLTPIPGNPSDTLPWAQGCAFSPRCSRSVDGCVQGPPALEPLTHLVRCVNPVPASPSDPGGASGSASGGASGGPAGSVPGGGARPAGAGVTGGTSAGSVALPADDAGGTDDPHARYRRAAEGSPTPGVPPGGLLPPTGAVPPSDAPTEVRPDDRRPSDSRGDT